MSFFRGRTPSCPPRRSSEGSSCPADSSTPSFSGWTAKTRSDHRQPIPRKTLNSAIGKPEFSRGAQRTQRLLCRNSPSRHQPPPLPRLFFSPPPLREWSHCPLLAFARASRRHLRCEMSFFAGMAARSCDSRSPVRGFLSLLRRSPPSNIFPKTSLRCLQRMTLGALAQLARYFSRPAVLKIKT
mgnify:CR=1 FL=1